jgi:hypothetical protein
MWTQQCSEQQMAIAGIRADLVRACITASNASVNIANNFYLNTLLELELQQRQDMLISRLPTLVVNDVILTGTPSPENLLAAICSAYPSSPKPLICIKCAGVAPADIASCMNPPGAASPAPSSMPGWAIGVIFAVSWCVGTLLA